MSVPLRILAVLVFALFLSRGAFACEPAQQAPVAYHHTVQSISLDGACAAATTAHHRSASCHAGCCAGCSSHCGLFPVGFSFDAGGAHDAAPVARAELHRAGIVRAPLLPPPIV